MKLFDVYPLFNIEPVRAKGSYLWDSQENQYLDMYGGHAVISIGHSHPLYIERISQQLAQIGFYSNSVKIPLQEELAAKLGALSGKSNYQLFLCNSGAEANENALKLASFHNGRKTVIAFRNSFHGRTSLAVAATDNPKIVAPVNQSNNIIFLPLNDYEALGKCFDTIGDEISSVIIEGIQGVGGIQVAEPAFLRSIREHCTEHGALYIADSVQCGYGRSGSFYSHDHAGVNADIYTMAKGMGNGFPVAGIAIAPHIEPKHGMLGTTFGGNHLACAAAIAVLDVMEQEQLMDNAAAMGSYLMDALSRLDRVKSVRGRGLMIGMDVDNGTEIRKTLLEKHRIFTGSASNKDTIRLLPALNVGKQEADQFLHALEQVLYS